MTSNMDLSVNSQPLLQRTESDSDSDGESESPRYDRDEALAGSSKNEDCIVKMGNPRDRYHFAYFIFYLLGMTTLLPWNFFITADSYWMFKLRDLNVSSPTPGRSVLQAEFISYVSLAANLPNTVFLVLNAVYGKRIPLKLRMLGSLLLIFGLFVMTTSLVNVNTDPWQQEFFALTLITVVVLNIGTAFLNAGLFGIVGCFPHRYITAVIGGQALGGVFAALVNIASIWLGESPQISALSYFLVADIVFIASIVSYIALTTSDFFKFYMSLKLRPMPFSPIDENDTEHPTRPNVSLVSITKRIWVHCFSICMVFVVTLAAFPAITVLINSVDRGNKKPWNDVYFVPVVGYLLFSICDYVGRLLAGWIRRPKRSTWLLAFFSVLRIGFVPLLMICNAEPRKSLPVLIDNDIYYILILTVFALSNGYLANITFINVPSQVNAAEMETASHVMTAFLGLGTSIGSALSLLMIRLL